MEVKKIKAGTMDWLKTSEYANSCSWVGGKGLAEAMSKNNFKQWEAVFVCINDNIVAGFCTLMETDYYPENRYFPWISNVFVDECFRGRGISRHLVNKAVEYAGEVGFSKVYIPSDITGLYEKYGFVKIDKLENYGGGMDNIFMRETK